MTTRAGALAGVRVLDITQVMAGAYCSMLLADMGADVIKIERPKTGDDTRRMSATSDIEASQAFVAMNRNKRGISLDLKDPAGADVVRRLARTADVLVENFRPGTMDKLGLGFDTLSAINPELVYCSISGFGATGPYRDLGGFDLVAQAMSGIMSVTGTPDGEPVKVGVPVCDLNAGLFGAFGVLNAYIHRLATGEGQFVDTSLLEAGIATTVWESNEWLAEGKVPAPTGSAHRLSAPYQALPTSDGHIAIGAANQRGWEAMCRAIHRTDLLEIEEYGSNPQRMANQRQLATELGRHLQSRSTDHWVGVLRAHGVACGPIYDVSQVHADAHMQHRGVTTTTSHPILGQVRHLTVPLRMSQTPAEVRRTAPLLGEHTREVLAASGFAEAEIDELVNRGVAEVAEGAALTNPA
ncbi:CaiB/BaiF CoA transferase family protein [Gordonia sp. KTR9]|uniref:CaiB/BaiF CoA transferase family protein n=1 Tax=Gordonia sp. KTR9 TaxID=337191 RepID=UPI00027DE65E|nr:CoA transferase [Gordonia sp. KTR9]AFR49811.1 putative acyl-CoA transferases/carnitine dehydratase [Gordonia sp. KTR9]